MPQHPLQIFGQGDTPSPPTISGNNQQLNLLNRGTGVSSNPPDFNSPSNNRFIDFGPSLLSSGGNTPRQSITPGDNQQTGSIGSEQPPFNPNNPQEFQDLVTSWGDDPGKARRYGEQHNYSPDQMARFYNAGDPTNPITGNEAAGFMGIDPSKSNDSLGTPGGFFNTRNPRTGQSSTTRDDPANFTNWQPGDDIISNAPSLSQMSDAEFFKNVNHLIDTKGKDDAALFLRSYMDKFGYSEADIGQAYDQGGGREHTPFGDIQQWLGSGGDPLAPFDSDAPENNPIQLFQPDLFPSSRSGLPQGDIDTLLKTLIPQLTGSISNFRGDIDASTKAASELFASQSRGLIEKDSTRVLNDLAASNVLDSSVASDALSKSLSNIATAGAGRSFEAAALGSAQKAREPEILAGIAGLGKVSESSQPGVPYDRILGLL